VIPCVSLPFEWFVALRYLRAKRKQAFISLISVISIAGVAVGVMALIVVISVMGGFEDHLRNKILGINAHVIVRSATGPFDDRTVISKIRDVKVPPEGLLGRLRGWISGDGGGARVEAVTPFVFIQALMSSGNAVSGAVIRGVDPGTVSSVLRFEEGSSGEWIAALEKPGEGLPPIVLGDGLAQTLGVERGATVQIILPGGTISPVGMLPKIRGFRVVGFVSTGMYDYDASLAFVRIVDAQRLLGIGDRVHGLEVRISDIYAADRVSHYMQERLGFPYSVLDWQQLSRNLFSALKLEKLAMFIILTLIVLVAAFNIVSTLIMLVMEKHQDIAVLKALGARDGQIMKIFVLTGFFVGLIGTGIGVGLGLAICEILRRYRFITIPKDVYFTDTIPVLLNPADVVIIAVSAVIICFLATIYPARQASRVDPAEALRIG